MIEFSIHTVGPVVDMLLYLLVRLPGVLADNCSSLYDCWPSVAPAAAAAVGAGAAAVLAAGVLTDHEGVGSDNLSARDENPLEASAGAPGAVTSARADAGQAGPSPQPAGGAGQTYAGAPGPTAVQGHSAGATPPVSPGAVVGPPPSTSPSASVPGAQPPGTLGTSTTAPAGPVAGQVSPPPVAAQGLSPVEGVVAAVTPLAVGAARAQQMQQQEEDEEETGEPCPEIRPEIFGLAETNTRRDSPGFAVEGGERYAGIDYSSKDESGNVRSLEFEAGVAGRVTAIGGEYNMIEVTRENGNRLQFLHASEIFVRLGEEVEPTTKIGVTGGKGPAGSHQYEIHLHVQARDVEGRPIDPDCAVAGKENRRLRVKTRQHPGEGERPAEH